jgi:hypothetical protein
MDQAAGAEDWAEGDIGREVRAVPVDCALDGGILGKLYRNPL